MGKRNVHFVQCSLHAAERSLYCRSSALLVFTLNSGEQCGKGFKVMWSNVCWISLFVVVWRHACCRMVQRSPHKNLNQVLLLPVIKSLCCMHNNKSYLEVLNAFLKREYLFEFWLCLRTSFCGFWCVAYCRMIYKPNMHRVQSVAVINI